MVLAGFVCGKQHGPLSLSQAAWYIVSLSSVSIVLAGFVCGKQHGTLSLSLLSPAFVCGKQHGPLSLSLSPWS